ncbi:VOC family protein [Schumannella sp. 10F1B-5-1]|uniref:VOC family protein n=1 Tax=Schumannella sp. 10F1B-5-1 TaxID=2590780 RepID=UPI0011307FE8|nr:VOC family protein [Schumannella sp. 10F1B-5-1]TPW72883.1 VOC family protein [Schumannella sp. 10F1B-5-1]
MVAILNPYLNFRDNAREAMEFYQSVLGGELNINTFGDFQMPGIEEAEMGKVMHAQLETPSGFTLMGSDTPAYMDFAPGTNFSVSLSGDEVDELRGYWAKLSEGATIQQELAPAPWGGEFGMLVDKFGIAWLVNVNKEADLG